jgi:hypothetical protein
VCKLGHYHPSAIEARYCAVLQLMLRAKKIKEFIYQKSYDLCVNSKKICAHKPDFTVEYYDGHIEVHEVKGFETNDYLLRKKLFEACYPLIPYVVIKKL